MKLNYNGFFVQRFLMAREFDLPMNVCRLARRVLLAAFIWGLLSVLCVFFLVTYLSGLWYTLVSVFTDTTLAELMASSRDIRASILMFFIMNGALGILGCAMSFLTYKSHLRAKAIIRQERIDAGELPPIEPNPTVEFVKSLWERIHDKTCRVIEYSNHPDDIRRAAREKERSEYMARIEAELKASQGASNNTD